MEALVWVLIEYVWLSGAEHIREVIPFPRDSRRVTP